MTSVAQADFFGGDLVLLTELVTNSLEQLNKLQVLAGKGQEQIDLIRDINKGIKDTIALSETLNRTITPGVFSDLNQTEQLLYVLDDLYGRVPKGPDAKLQSVTDKSVAEGIQLHNEAFKYADKVDPEGERIKEHAAIASPQTAQRLTAQSAGVMIHVMNQMLRTNAAILKIHSEDLALKNRKEKIESEQVQSELRWLSQGLKQRPNYQLSKF